MFWFNLLQNEFNWGFLDANGVYWYVTNGNITQAQYHEIINK